MRLLLCLLTWPFFSIGQDIPVKELFNKFTHRNDTLYLAKEWSKYGYPDADYLYDSFREFNALGEPAEGGKVVRDYVGVYLDFAENIHVFNNRELYYRTGSKQRYLGWGKSLDSLGFVIQSWSSNEKGEGTVYSKGPITAKVAMYYERYKSYKLDKQEVFVRSDRFDTGDVGYVLTFVIQPALTTGEVFDLFEKRKDTSFIIKSLRDHGFTEHQSQKDMIAVMGYHSRLEQYYSENFMVFLHPGNLVCYQTETKELYAAWKADLPAKGFAEAITTEPDTIAYRNGRMDALLRKQLLSDGRTIYLMYLRLNQ